MQYYPHPFTVDESREWIERWLAHEEEHGFSLWAIEDRETMEFPWQLRPRRPDRRRRAARRDRMVGHNLAAVDKASHPRLPPPGEIDAWDRWDSIT
jgi:hypothetical protein